MALNIVLLNKTMDHHSKENLIIGAGACCGGVSGGVIRRRVRKGANKERKAVNGRKKKQTKSRHKINKDGDLRIKYV